MDKSLIGMLILLAKNGAHLHGLKLSLGWLSHRLNTSRQTAARWLIELEDRGLIKREPGPRGQSVRLTSAGIASLRSMYHDLEAIFSIGPRALKLTGRVVSGLGEGSYYVRQKGYRRQFERELGFNPYLGTLDVKLDKASLEVKEALQGLMGKNIEGFTTSERTFGPVKCFAATLRGSKVSIVLPARSYLKDILEIVAPQNLRKKFKLRDGDEVKFEVMV